MGYVEDLGALSSATLATFTLELCKARALDNHSFRVFVAAAGSEIFVPDCAGVDEQGMVAGLLGLGGNVEGDEADASGGGASLVRKQRPPPTATLVGRQELNEEGEAAMFGREALGVVQGAPPGGTSHITSLTLSHCGRGFSDRAVRALLRGGGDLASTSAAFSNLSTLSLHGAYALTDVGLTSLLKAAGACLTTLQIRAAPQITGEFLKQLPSLCPNLMNLELDGLSHKCTPTFLSGECSAGGEKKDMELLEPVRAVGSPSSKKRPRTSGNTQRPRGEEEEEEEGEEEGGEEIDLGLQQALAASLAFQASGTIGEGLDNPRPTTSSSKGGIFALSSLSGLSLVNLPSNAMPEPFLVSLLHHLGPQLKCLRLKRLDGCSDAVLEALAESALPLGRLEKLSLEELRHVSDGGLDVLACALQKKPPKLTALCLNSLRGVSRGDVILATVLGSCAAFSERQQLQMGTGFPKVTEESTTTTTTTTSSSSSISSPPLLLTTASTVASAVSTPRCLEHLTLSHLPSLSDASIAALLAAGTSRTLQTLDLSMSRGVSDGAVGSLVDACPRLRRLVVWGCTNLTGLFFRGHARAGWDGKAPAPPACASHPDLPWSPCQVIGQAGARMPPAQEDLKDYYFP